MDAIEEPQTRADDWEGRRLTVPLAVVALVTTTVLAHRLPPHDWVHVAVGAAVAALTVPALAAPLRDAPRRVRRATMVAALLAMVAGLAEASDSLDAGHPRPLLWLVAGVGVAWVLPWFQAGRRITFSEAGGTLFFAFYCMTALFLAIRLGTGRNGPSEAGSAVGVADSAFDVMVFALVRDRFGQLNATQDQEHAVEFLNRPEDADVRPEFPTSSKGQQILLEIVLLGFGVAVALLVLLSAAARPLGLDATTDGAPGRTRLLLLAGVGILAVVFAACELLSRRLTRPSPDDEPLRAQQRLLVVAAGGALTWGAVVAFCGGQVHHHAAATIGAVVAGVIATESILMVSTTLRLRSPTRGEVALAALCGAATLLSVRWLLLSGVWQSTTAAAESVFLVLLGNGILHLTAGRLLAWSLPDRDWPTEHELNREATYQHVLQDAVNAVVLGFVALAVPMHAIGRAEMVHRGALSVVSSMVFLPGLLAAMLWAWTTTSTT
jgi:hypothetical protein